MIWSGQYEYLERATARLKIVVPVTLLIIFLLLYLNFRSITETLIVMLSLPFALVGGLWLMWWLGFNLSVAVVGRLYRTGRCRRRDRRGDADLPQSGLCGSAGANAPPRAAP